MLRILFALIVVLTGSTVWADVIEGRVVGVTDGDTIKVLDGSKHLHKIRLSGIDAPEHDQPFGQRSKQHLSDVVFGKNVSVEWNKLDRYGRTIGKVLVNGVDANLEQLRAGLAWWYRKYAKEQSTADRRAYEQAEDQARGNRRGLWGDSTAAIPPWNWRHR